MDAPLCLRPSAWDSEAELPDEAPDAPDVIAAGVGFVDIRGPLAEEPDTLCGWYDGYDGEDGIAARFERAVYHPDAVAALVQFKSPGGTSAGILECIRRMVRARDAVGIPVIGFVKEACSAAYWVASRVCNAGLYGDESAESGSIGSYIPHESIAAYLAKEGIAYTLIADPPGKVACNSFEALSDKGRARLERRVTACTARFVRDVETGRALSEEAIRALDGDVLEGFAAVEAGLMDGLADLETTVSLVLALAGERARKAS